jgi:opacity protein-like surface antigen
MNHRESRLLTLSVILLGVFLLSVPRTVAQDAKKSFAAPGVVELGGSASYSYTQQVSNGTTSDGVHSVAVMPSLGYFVAEGIEIVANPLGFSLWKGGSTTVIDMRLLGGVAYNAKVQPGIYPFLEGLAGLTLRSYDADGAKTTVSGFSWGGRGGVKFAVTSHGMLNVGIQYLQIALTPSGADKRYGTNELSVAAGFTVWL